MWPTRAKILNDSREPVGAHERHRAVELVEQQLDPQLAGVVLDDEQHLVVDVGDRPLRREQLVELQVVAVAASLGELDVDRSSSSRRFSVIAAM